jgi:hypothetical protein
MSQNLVSSLPWPMVTSIWWDFPWPYPWAGPRPPKSLPPPQRRWPMWLTPRSVRARRLGHIGLSRPWRYDLRPQHPRPRKFPSLSRPPPLPPQSGSCPLCRGVLGPRGAPIMAELWDCGMCMLTIFGPGSRWGPYKATRQARTTAHTRYRPPPTRLQRLRVMSRTRIHQENG